MKPPVAGLAADSAVSPRQARIRDALAAARRAVTVGRRAMNVGRRAMNVARIVHPFPTLLNVAATAGLAFVAAGGAPPVSILARMLAIMFLAQSAIGVANDLFDRDLDAATKPWKPIVRGSVTPRAAALLAAVLVVVAIALAFTLGAKSAVLAMLGTACGLAYDMRLKRTALSALPFTVAVPVLPAWVWVTLDAWEPRLWWIAPLGALIGLSLHLANTLPDIDGDAAHGVRGMAHRLGRRRSALLAWSSYVAALALAIALAPVLRYDLTLFVPAIAIACASLEVSVALARSSGSETAMRIGFGALGIGAAVAAVGWLAAVS